MGQDACIGAITERKKSVRLTPSNRDPYEGTNHDYNVGDVWEISAEPVADPIPPHTEDIVVHERQYLRAAADPVGLLNVVCRQELGIHENSLRASCEQQEAARFTSLRGTMCLTTAPHFGDRIGRSLGSLVKKTGGIAILPKMVAARSPSSVSKNQLRLFPPEHSCVCR